MPRIGPATVHTMIRLILLATRKGHDGDQVCGIVEDADVVTPAARAI